MANVARDQIVVVHSQLDSKLFEDLRFALTNATDNVQLLDFSTTLDDPAASLVSAKVILLAVSPRFDSLGLFALDALEKAQKDGATVLWISLSAGNDLRDFLMFKAAADPGIPLDQLDSTRRNEVVAAVAARLIETLPVETPAEYDYDVFVSYGSDAGTWVTRELQPRIGAAELKAFLYLQDLRLDGSHIEALRQRVTRSRIILPVLTPGY